MLVVGILIADHFSKARTAQLNVQLNDEATERFGTVAMTEPEVLANPIPGGAVDPLAAAEIRQPVTLPLETEGVVLVMGEPRPRLDGGLQSESEAVGALSSAQLIGGTIDRLGLGAMPPAAQMDEPVAPVEPLPTAPAPELQTAPPPRITTASELPVSRGRLISHEVVRGDNLTKIAGKYYGDTSLWKPLQGYNAGRVAADGTIRLGVTLLIPPKDVLLGEARLPDDAKAVPASTLRQEPPKAAEKPQTKPAAPKPSKADKPATRTYTVKPGDTLAKIAARQLGASKRWKEIHELNKAKLEDSDTIRVGMVLVLPAE